VLAEGVTRCTADYAEFTIEPAKARPGD